MKRHIARTPTTTEAPVLSVEELAILADENSEAEIGVANDADQMERVTEIAEVANDTMTVVNEMPEVGTVEQALVSAVADMAVAGTDSDPEEILSVSNTDGVVSAEGIVSVLKSIWDAIITSIKNMWVGLKHWLTTYFSQLEQNKKHAEKLIERLSGMSGYVSGHGDITTMDILGYAGYHGIKAMIGGTDLEERKFRELVPKVIQTQFALMHPLGGAVADAFGKMKALKPEAGADAALDVTEISEIVDLLNEKLVDYCKKLDLGQSVKEATRWESKPVANMTIIAKNVNSKATGDNISPQTKLANLVKVRFSADQRSDMVNNTGLKLRADATPEDLKDLVQKRLDFINQLLAIKADQFDKLEKQVETVEKACEAMLAQVKQDDKKALGMAKSWMPLVTAYANWATQPAAKLLSIAARHNKFWLTISEMGTNNFVKGTA